MQRFPFEVNCDQTGALSPSGHAIPVKSGGLSRAQGLKTLSSVMPAIQIHSMPSVAVAIT